MKTLMIATTVFLVFAGAAHAASTRAMAGHQRQAAAGLGADAHPLGSWGANSIVGQGKP